MPPDPPDAGLCLLPAPDEDEDEDYDEEDGHHRRAAEIAGVEARGAAQSARFPEMGRRTRPAY